jgi:hypothetical protein
MVGASALGLAHPISVLAADTVPHVGAELAKAEAAPATNSQIETVGGFNCKQKLGSFCAIPIIELLVGIFDPNPRFA